MLKDKEIIQQKDNDKINHNDIQTCNITILNYLKRLIFFPKCMCYIILLKILVTNFLRKTFIKFKIEKIPFKITYVI